MPLCLSYNCDCQQFSRPSLRAASVSITVRPEESRRCVLDRWNDIVPDLDLARPARSQTPPSVPRPHSLVPFWYIKIRDGKHSDTAHGPRHSTVITITARISSHRIQNSPGPARPRPGHMFFSMFAIRLPCRQSSGTAARLASFHTSSAALSEGRGGSRAVVVSQPRPWQAL